MRPDQAVDPVVGGFPAIGLEPVGETACDIVSHAAIPDQEAPVPAVDVPEMDPEVPVSLALVAHMGKRDTAFRVD
jgi:hypothetical protein